MRLAVFDCDGTLVDSQHSIVAAMPAACDAPDIARPAP
ncbi:MAG: haloacid dehalogenase, partial [Proteobacteria bacterium]|nr:haloacid dehalogenase [Pseudomonadota bacterium]